MKSEDAMAKQQSDSDKPVRVQITDACIVAPVGVEAYRAEVGEVIEVPPGTAMDLVSAGKATTAVADAKGKAK
jgi:hypothetical protein